VEGLRLRAGDFLNCRHAIFAVTHLAALIRLLPERDPHEDVFDAFETLLDRIDAPTEAATRAVVFELHMLAELGFGLDLSACAATGTTSDLAYVSPKSGRAVSRAAGEAWRDKLLPLPCFLLHEDATPTATEIADGFALTGFFLERHAFEPRGLVLGDARAHFVEAILRLQEAGGQEKRMSHHPDT
jgi:DNA repair protein RecO (recombination protein O)